VSLLRLGNTLNSAKAGYGAHCGRNSAAGILRAEEEEGATSMRSVNRPDVVHA
jgi:hypothetical protein